MAIPKFKLLSDKTKAARLITICNAVEPLLGSNYLSYFTDHSVNHSDQLCNLVNELASSLGQKKALNSEEAFVLLDLLEIDDETLRWFAVVSAQDADRLSESEQLL